MYDQSVISQNHTVLFFYIFTSMINAKLVREGMNRCGAKGVPFLFGVDFEMSQGFLVEHPLQDSRIPFVAGNITNVKEFRDETFPSQPEIEVLRSDYREYERKFGIVRSGLLHGDSFLLNLTAKTPIAMNLTLEQLFRYSQARYKLLLPDRLVCFSPECFVHITGQEICSYPMKGTIDASLPDAAQQLLRNQKEICEHNTIVDLLRNDLSTVARKVEVRRFRYVEKIKNLRGEILQTSSEIAGQLPMGYQKTIGDILFSLLPAGSVSGAPKPATTALIREAEQIPRGFYTGIFGYFDGSSLDSAVMIRYIEKEDGQYYFRSGGGITTQSSPAEEYQELLDKIYLPIPVL